MPACSWGSLFQATLAFWTTQTLEIVNTVTYGGVETAQYPLDIYRPWFRSIFIIVVPLGSVCYFPAMAIMGKADPLGSSLLFQWLAPLIGVAFLAVAVRVWEFGRAPLPFDRFLGQARSGGGERGMTQRRVGSWARGRPVSWPRLEAARLGAEVHIYDTNALVGRKLLVTGNGRCNISNLPGGRRAYVCADPSFLATVLSVWGPEAVLARWKEYGMPHLRHARRLVLPAFRVGRHRRGGP